MEQIINYRDIPTDKRIDILNALERIGFFPAYGGVRTMPVSYTHLTLPTNREGTIFSLGTLRNIKRSHGLLLAIWMSRS